MKEKDKKQKEMTRKRRLLKQLETMSILSLSLRSAIIHGTIYNEV